MAMIFVILASLITVSCFFIKDSAGKINPLTVTVIVILLLSVVMVAIAGGAGYYD